VNALLGLIEKERPFFEPSGGGVTFSGGEPLLFPDFLMELLEACGQRHIHRAVDTSGYVNSDVLLRVAAATDLFLYDLKTLDAKQHLRLTGVDNQRILDNLRLLAAFGSTIQVRVPLIGGLNNDARSLELMAEFVAALPGNPIAVSLLPFHDVAQGKDQKLGRSRSMDAFSVPTPEDIQRAADIFSACRVKVAVGG
jgi:pyruvate formate lyase activating enzyme